MDVSEKRKQLRELTTRFRAEEQTTSAGEALNLACEGMDELERIHREVKVATDLGGGSSTVLSRVFRILAGVNFSRFLEKKRRNTKVRLYEIHDREPYSLYATWDVEGTLVLAVIGCRDEQLEAAEAAEGLTEEMCEAYWHTDDLDNEDDEETDEALRVLQSQAWDLWQRYNKGMK